MKIRKSVTGIMIPFIVITLLCSCGSGSKEDKPIVIKNSHGQHGAMSVIVYEVGDTKKCKECGQSKE